MEILKIAIEWAKAEVFSSRFFILFAILFLIASIGFWQLGKTETAKAYIIPTLVAGTLLLAVGLGIFFTNKSRVTSFATAYNTNPTEFVTSEITRTEKSMGEYKTIVFKIIPFIIVAAALLIVFIDKPLWRAISITTIVMMGVILLIDSNANSRIESYHKQLELVDKEEGVDLN
jgi:drug/metabolite transporter (DMT)-like permease